MAPPSPSRQELAPSGQRARTLDAGSRAWLDALAATGARRERAVADLYRFLLGAVRQQMTARRGWAQPDRDHLMQEAAGDALLAVVSRLEDFRGESRFTTWAYSFAVHKTIATLAHAARHQPPLALDDASWERVADRRAQDPHAAAERRELLAALRRALDSDLSQRQREVFITVALNEVPIEALADCLSSNRNAVYQNLFDARRKLRASLAAAGYGIPA
jgi:RNA polymerase sigma-70 factor (ECF subfamily)